MRYIVKPLTRDKLRKKAVFFDKLIVFAVFNYLSVVKNDDSVALLYGGQTMGNYEPRAFKRVKRLGYFFLREVVKCACCLIEHQYFRLRGDCTRNHQSLALSARYAA